MQVKSIYRLFLILFSFTNFFGCSHSKKCEEDQSVLTFGYDNFRSGVQRTCQNPHRTYGAAELLSGTESGALSQVLVRTKGAIAQIVFVNERGLHIRSLEKDAKMKTVEFKPMGWGSNRSTPVISSDQKFLYGVYHYGNEKEITHRIFSYNFETEDFDFFDIDSKKLDGQIPKLASFMFCKTAIALNEKNNQISFGCSLLRIEENWYASEDGIRGGLMIVNLGPDRKIIKNQSSAKFVTFANRDASVWMSGSAPAITPNGLYAVTTGNGVVDTKLKQYSCSLALVNAKGEIINYFSIIDLAKLPNSFCDKRDLDLSASGVTISNDPTGSYWIAMNGKDGFFRVIDYHAKIDKNIDYYFQPIGTSGFLFGQPIALGKDWITAAETKSNYNSEFKWTAYRMKVDAKNKIISNAWKVERKGLLHRASPSALIDENGSGIVAFLEAQPGSDDSNLLLIDVQTGQVLQSLAFKSQMHFSMPTFWNDRIFLGVPSVGVYMLTAH